MSSQASPLRFLLSGAGIQLVTLVVSAVIGFVLTPYVIHSLGDRDYGLLILVGSFAGWLGLVDFGLSGAVARYVAVNFSAGDRQTSNSYASTGFALYLFLGLLAFLFAAAATLTLPWFLTYEKDIPIVRTLILISAAAFAVDMPLRAISGLLNGYMRRDITSGLMLLGRVVNASATAAILFTGGGVIAVSTGALAIGVVMALLWIVVTYRVIPGYRLSPTDVDRAKARSLFKFGGISFVGHVAEAVISRLDAFVIAWFIAIAAVSHYMIAATLVAYFSSAVIAMTGWLMNWFAHKMADKNTEVTETLYIATRYGVIVGGFGLYGLIAFGHAFIERWMGSEYLDAYPCLVALAIGEFIRACQRPAINLLFATAMHHIYAWTRVLEAVLNLVISIILVQWYGLVGVALGTMIASLLVNGLVFPLAASAASGFSLLRFGRAVAHGVTVMALVALLCTAIAYKVIKPDYVSLLVAGGISVIVFVPLALGMGTSRGERRRLLASFEEYNPH